jgi:hypothetical protein
MQPNEICAQEVEKKANPHWTFNSLRRLVDLVGDYIDERE